MLISINVDSSLKESSMFGTSIQELFGSISVGILTVYFAFYLHYYLMHTIKCKDCKKVPFLTYYKDKIDQFNSTNTGLVFIVFVFVFAIGQLMEDITDNVTDSDSEIPKFLLPNVAQFILGSEEKFRFQVLITKKKPDCVSQREEDREKDKEKDQKWCLQLTPLGRYVFTHDEAVSNILESNSIYTDSINLLIDSLMSLSNKEYDSTALAQLKSVTNSLYYKSKNWCYTNNSNHFQELELIQNRVDFSRSSILIAILYLFLFFLLFVYQVIKIYRLSRRVQKVKGQKNQETKGKLDASNELATQKSNLFWLKNKLFYPTLFLISLFVISWIGYGITEQNYNERVFGYYFSNIDDMKMKDEIMGEGAD